MSTWTHIFGVLTVNCSKYRLGTDEYKPQAQELHQLVNITGSERDAEIFVNASSSLDLSDFSEKENAWIDYSNRLYLTIAGDLRDRNVHIVKEELKDIFIHLNNLGYYIDEDRSVGVFEDGTWQLSITEVYTELFPPEYTTNKYIKEVK